MARERFYNSATQPSGPDCLVASVYTPGDGVLVVDNLPTFIGIDGFSAGDQFRIKCGSTLYLVSALGAGNVHWTVTVIEGTADASHVVGTGVYLDETAGTLNSIRALDSVTATDQTANGYPNSVPLASVAAADLLDAVATTDARLSNARTPTAHAGSHAGGSDPLPIESLPTAETDATKVFAPDGAGGVVARAEAGGGSSTFAGLSDVQLASLANGDVPIWNTTDGKWENGPQTGGGGGGGGGVSYGAYASRPSPSTAGALYLATDSPIESLDTGTAWLERYHGETLVNDGFPATWVNQSTATKDTSRGGVYMVSEINGGNVLNILDKAAPSLPYTITVPIVPAIYRPNSNYNFCGLLWRDSASGKVAMWRLYYNGNQSAVLSLAKYNSPTSLDASYGDIQVPCYPRLFLRLHEDSTNREAWMSPDGIHFTRVFQVSRTDFLTADRVGIGVAGFNSSIAAEAWFQGWDES